jgi:GMP synthase-like glutamine amidotransferase
MSMKVNELGKPGVPNMTDVILGLPGPVQQNPPPVVDKLGRVITIPSHNAIAPSGKRMVTVIRDVEDKYPDMWLAIYVVGDIHEERAFAKMFVRAACRRATCVDEADIVVFTGGTDVDPSLYGHERHHTTDIPDRKRDDREMEIFLECKAKGVPMLGVCRGAQFLHVMHGGALYQDVSNHNGTHPIITLDGLVIPDASSVHHQMIIPDPKLGIQILATSNIAGHRSKWGGKPGTFYRDTEKKADVEAFFYRETCSLGVQGHPEYSGYPIFTAWVMDQIDQFIHCSPDCTFVGEKDNYRYRIKPELVLERQSWPVQSSEQEQIEEEYSVKNKSKKVKEILTVPKSKKETK